MRVGLISVRGRQGKALNSPTNDNSHMRESLECSQRVTGWSPWRQPDPVFTTASGSAGALGRVRLVASNRGEPANAPGRMVGHKLMTVATYDVRAIV